MAEEAERVEEAEEEELLPAWSLASPDDARIDHPLVWPDRITRDWAWGGSEGEGVRVCVLDSGIERSHPLVGEVQGAVSIDIEYADDDDEEGKVVVEEDTEGDLCGHGTACGGIIRSLAPQCELHSVRVLGAGYTGSGPILLGGLRWAIDQGFDVINMSLSTSKRQFVDVLHELADTAYFKRSVLVASAHNMPVESYPWKFSAVISVGSHQEADPLTYYYNTRPPVEFFARGVDVRIPWLGGSTIRATGNSFATPHIAGICALVLGKHRELTPFQLKHVLYMTANNVGGEPK